MFGLSSKDQNYNSQSTQLDTAPPAEATFDNPQPTSPSSTGYPANDYSTVSDTSSAGTAPLLTDPMLSSAAADTISPATSPPTPSVNLENAYIPTDPPQINNIKGSGSDDHPAKPSAVSLMSGSSEAEMLKMKQQALTSLAPLVDHLDQTPEEKFKTTMMLIQASDNAELVKDAYEAANEITDEKTRARALLDVVNEINYFTQHGGSKPATQSI